MPAVLLSVVLVLIVPVLVLSAARLWVLTVIPALGLVGAMLISGMWALGIAGRLVPRHVRLGRPRELTEEATVLFVDLRDSTPMVERLDPRQAGAIQASLLELLARIVRRHGGEVERTLGDGMLALFRHGATPHHTLRAIAATREMLERVAELSPTWERNYGVAAGITAGLETGLVSGTVLLAEVEEWSSSGRAVNQAARLQSACKDAGVSVLVGPGTGALVRDEVKLRLVGGLTLKGISEPVVAYTLEDGNGESHDFVQ